MNTAVYIGALNTVSQIDWYSQHSGCPPVGCLSSVNELFGGQLVDLRLCDSCRRVAVSTQLFHILPVPLVSASPLYGGPVSLDTCLQQFARIEQLTAAIQCEQCNRLRAAIVLDPSVSMTPVGNHVAPPLSPICSSPGSEYGLSTESLHQRTSTPISQSSRQPQHQQQQRVMLTDCRRRSLVGYLPGCLVIQLMRFTDSVQKLSVPVRVPLRGLDLSSFVLHNVDPAQAGLAAPTSDTYDLYAVCVHIGADSTSSGHYVTYARRRPCTDVSHDDAVGGDVTGDWYCFDDERVRAVNMDYELTTRLVRENAYLLFYERTAFE